MKFHATQTTYVTDALTDANFVAIIDYDRHATEGTTNKTLLSKLEALDCDRVEYDPHFGPYIGFTLAVTSDTPKKHTDIARVIKNHMQLAVRWASRQKKVR